MNFTTRYLYTVVTQDTWIFFPERRMESIVSSVMGSVTEMSETIEKIDKHLDKPPDDSFSQEMVAVFLARQMKMVDDTLEAVEVMKTKCMKTKEKIADFTTKLGTITQKVNEVDLQESEEQLLREIAINEEKLMEMGISANFLETTRAMGKEFLDWGEHNESHQYKGFYLLIRNMEKLSSIRMIRKHTPKDNDAIQDTPV